MWGTQQMRKGSPGGHSFVPGNRSSMVHGLSPVRQPASGFACTLLSSIGERPWAGFLLLAAAHTAIWTILPFALYPNLPLDIIEALTYGREWQLGYDKLPPLPWWLVEVAYRLFGVDWVYYLIAQITVLAAFWLVWLLARRLVGGAGALVAMLIV